MNLQLLLFFFFFLFNSFIAPQRHCQLTHYETWNSLLMQKRKGPGGTRFSVMSCKHVSAMTAESLSRIQVEFNIRFHVNFVLSANTYFRQYVFFRRLVFHFVFTGVHGTAKDQLGDWTQCSAAAGKPLISKRIHGILTVEQSHTKEHSATYLHIHTKKYVLPVTSWQLLLVQAVLSRNFKMVCSLIAFHPAWSHCKYSLAVD